MAVRHQALRSYHINMTKNNVLYKIWLLYTSNGFKCIQSSNNSQDFLTTLSFQLKPTCAASERNPRTMSSQPQQKPSLVSDTTPKTAANETKPKMFDKEGAIGQHFTGTLADIITQISSHFWYEV